MLRSCTRKSGKVSQSFEIYVHPIELFLGKPPISSTRMIKALDENSNQPKIVNFRTAGIKEIRVKGYQSKVMQGKFCCESFWRNYRPAKQRHDPTIFTSMPKFLFIKRARFTWKAFATLKKGGATAFFVSFSLASSRLGKRDKRINRAIPIMKYKFFSSFFVNHKADLFSVFLAVLHFLANANPRFPSPLRSSIRDFSHFLGFEGGEGQYFDDYLRRN